MKLDLTSLKKATESFLIAIEKYESDKDDEFVRDSVIQRFEYSYELSTKMIKRYLSETSADPSIVNELSFQEHIREAYTKGLLLNSWDQWKIYREDRNRTSHGYDEESAKSIAENVKQFHGELHYLIEKLEEYNSKQ
ncbi:MAG: nucleotidyltransferase [Denitrovibrio sp.]|nr:MAG: nucleotidyltransferase [Denitrovibrio sp.]